MKHHYPSLNLTRRISLFQNSLKSKSIIPLLLFNLLLWNCKESESKGCGATIATERELIASGEKLFDHSCSACHNFAQDAIGPNLSGLTRSVETQWIKDFIRSPQNMIFLKDGRATELKKKYLALMPDFPNLSDAEMNALLAFLHTHEKKAASFENDTLQPVKNPIRDAIPFSERTAQLEFMAQVPASQKETPTARINKLACEPDSGRLFINDLRGFLYELKDGNALRVLSLKDSIPNFTDSPGLGTGFGSFAFHPDFSKNGLFYTTHTENTGSKPADFTLPKNTKVKFQWILTEWKIAPKAQVFSGSSRELMRIDFLDQVHGVQEIAFNPHSSKGDRDFGMLYMGIGDGGAIQAGLPEIADHGGTDIWTAILRIDPQGNNSANKRYGIPKDNPYYGSPTLKQEIWAYGFRNPNRLTWDPSGRMLASDIGETNIEEVNVVEPGKFYGWPKREGAFLFNPKGDHKHVYPLPKEDGKLAVTYPFLQYDHDEGPAISGGFVAKNKPFDNQYIFGDIPTGQVFVADLSLPNPKIERVKIIFGNKETTFAEMTGSNRVELRFGRGCNGEIYLFTKADGKVYKLK